MSAHQSHHGVHHQFCEPTGIVGRIDVRISNETVRTSRSLGSGFHLFQSEILLSKEILLKYLIIIQYMFDMTRFLHGQTYRQGERKKELLSHWMKRKKRRLSKTCQSSIRVYPLPPQSSFYHCQLISNTLKLTTCCTIQLHPSNPFLNPPPHASKNITSHHLQPGQLRPRSPLSLLN